MRVFTDFNKLKQVEESLWVEEPLFASSAAKDGVPQTVKQTKTEKDVPIGGSNVFILQVWNDDIDAVFLAKKFFVFFAVLAQVSQNGETKLFDFDRVLFLIALQKIKQVVHDSFFSDFEFVVLFK